MTQGSSLETRLSLRYFSSLNFWPYVLAQELTDTDLESFSAMVLEQQ